MILAAVCEAAFVVALMNLQERRRLAQRRGYLTEADISFLRKFSIIFCVFNATGCAAMASLEQTLQQFYLGLTATQMVTLLVVFLFMRDDARWPGVVAYSYAIQILVCVLKEGVSCDIRSLVIISNIGAAHGFVIWSWRKDVITNFDLQVRLHLKQNYYWHLFEFFPDAIALYTRKGISYVNKCCAQAFCKQSPELQRLKTEELVQHSFRYDLKRAEDELPLDSKAMLELERSKARDEKELFKAVVEEEEFVLKTEDERIFAVKMAATEYLYEEEAILVVLSDVTERQELHGKLVAEQVQSRMLSSMSHEFRNPLNHIGGALFFAKENLHRPNYASEQLDLGTCSLELLLLKVLDFQDYVEIQRGTFGLQRENVSVVDVVLSVLKLFAFSTGENKRLDLLVKNVSRQTTVTLDKQRIKQVLANLVSNAIK